MANVFEKAEKFGATALEILKKEIKGAGLFVHKYGKADFVGALDDTINIKRPPILRAYDAGFRNRNSRVISTIQQSRIQVSLDRFPASEVAITPEEATLDEVDYVRDIQAPQVRALVEDFDESIAGALKSADFVFEVDFVPSTTEEYPNDPRYVAGRAKRHLDSAKVPTTGRYWLVGAEVSENIAGCKGLLEVDKSGLPEALREGVVGKLRGFIVVDWPSLGEQESYFVHETAVALATVAPVVPNGAKGGATVQADGLAVTQLWDYDPTDKSDHSTVHTFTGATVVLDPEVGSDGAIVLGSNGKPRMDFFRGVKVNFLTAVSSSEGKVWTVADSGTVSGGTFTLSVDGDATTALAYNATNDVIVAALNELDGVAGAKVTGTTTKTITFKKPIVLTAGTGSLTGTTPGKTLTKVS